MRSPRPATAGRSSRSWTRRVVPGATTGGADRMRTRASTSALARCTRTRAWSLSGRSPGSSESSASTIDVARSVPGRVRTSPRVTSATSMPARFTAARWPASTRGAAAPCTCSPRTRTRRPEGRISSSSPAAMVPATSVPVTTVPNPLSTNARSMGRRTSPPGRARRRLRRHPPQLGPQRVEALAGARRHAQDGRPLEEGAGHQLARLDLRQRDAVRVGHVALGEHDGAPRDGEQPADVEVLAGLRHHRFVGGDDQQDGVDAVGAGQHVAHEPLVAGHVDERCDRPAAEVEVREAEIDGDPALLLFLQAVGVGAGEGADQRALPMVDVARGADDEGAHGVSGHAATPRGW